MNTVSIQSEVNADIFPHVLKMLEKFNRKAIKLGAIPFTIQNKNSFVKIIDKMECHRISFDVVGEIPVINGWKPIAVIDHVEGLVKGNASPQYVKHANCEHCNQNRIRNITCILQNTESGKLIQVGKTCLRDFLGHDPSAMLNYNSFVDSLTEYCEENSGGRGIAIMDLVTILAITIACVKEYGYISRKMCETDFTASATSATVSGLYYSKDRRDQEFVQKAYTAHIEAAKEMMKWIADKEVDPENSYWYNLKTIIENEYATFKSIGFACSIVPAYHKETAERIERESRLNEYFGEVGKKVELELEYTKSFVFDTAYGRNHLHFFKDGAGRTFKWSTNKALEAAAGNTVTVTASVKAHEEYKGCLQTVLTRAKIK